MKFYAWIDEVGGVSKAAAMLEVTPHTIWAWLRGETRPKWTTVEDIVKYSKGRVRLREVQNICADFKSAQRGRSRQ